MKKQKFSESDRYWVVNSQGQFGEEFFITEENPYTAEIKPFGVYCGYTTKELAKEGLKKANDERWDM